jgi:hypothetical protein
MKADEIEETRSLESQRLGLHSVLVLDRLQNQVREGSELLWQQTRSLQQATCVVDQQRLELEVRDEQLKRAMLRQVHLENEVRGCKETMEVLMQERIELESKLDLLLTSLSRASQERDEAATLVVQLTRALNIYESNRQGLEFLSNGSPAAENAGRRARECPSGEYSDFLKSISPGEIEFATVRGGWRVVEDASPSCSVPSTSSSFQLDHQPDDISDAVWQVDSLRSMSGRQRSRAVSADATLIIHQTRTRVGSLEFEGGDGVEVEVAALQMPMPVTAASEASEEAGEEWERATQACISQLGGAVSRLEKMLCSVQLQREVEEASECWRRKERVLERKAHAILHDILCLFEKTGRRRDRIEA